MILTAPSRAYLLRLTVASCVALEAEAGDTLEALTGKANKGQVGAIRWLLWAGLQAEHAEVIQSPEDAGVVIDAVGGLRVVRPAIGAFLALNADDSDDLKSFKTDKKRPEMRRSWREWYVQARSIGIGIEDFWRLSLRELWREFAVARVKAKQERDRDLTLAWHCAALVWQKKLPSLDKLLSRGERRQTPEEAKAAVLQISELYGLPVRKRKKKR